MKDYLNRSTIPRYCHGINIHATTNCVLISPLPAHSALESTERNGHSRKLNLPAPFWLNLQELLNLPFSCQTSISFLFWQPSYKPKSILGRIIEENLNRLWNTSGIPNTGSFPSSFSIFLSFFLCMSFCLSFFMYVCMYVFILKYTSSTLQVHFKYTWKPSEQVIEALVVNSFLCGVDTSLPLRFLFLSVLLFDEP